MQGELDALPKDISLRVKAEIQKHTTELKKKDDEIARLKAQIHSHGAEGSISGPELAVDRSEIPGSPGGSRAAAIKAETLPPGLAEFRPLQKLDAIAAYKEPLKLLEAAFLLTPSGPVHTHIYEHAFCATLSIGSSLSCKIIHARKHTGITMHTPSCIRAPCIGVGRAQGQGGRAPRSHHCRDSEVPLAG